MNTTKYAVKRSGHYLIKRHGRCVDWSLELQRATLFTTYYQAKKRADLELATVVSVEIREVML